MSEHYLDIDELLQKFIDTYGSTLPDPDNNPEVFKFKLKTFLWSEGITFEND